MTYYYIKALHIIFIVTWFAGMFYMVRLFIYNTEAGEKEETEKAILRKQFSIMIKRLWLGITWPSAILTLIFGGWMFSYYATAVPQWLWVKLGFVIGLYVYHFSLQKIYAQEMKGIFKYSSNQLRIWNEVATIFLIAIIMIVTVKDSMSWLYGIIGLALFTVALMSAIKVYKILRTKKEKQ
ncbi:MAG: CopD family protein [Bacteroidetes bacterium]|nr:CopD family protein [Bacteroidota bacterium]